MSETKTEFQQGRILYEVVVGIFKASGTAFEAWCRNSKITPNIGRNALLGANSGPSGQKLMQRLIDGAGRDVVEVAYRKRMDLHVANLKSGAAA